MYGLDVENFGLSYFKVHCEWTILCPKPFSCNFEPYYLWMALELQVVGNEKPVDRVFVRNKK